jgi:hypothetical protein
MQTNQDETTLQEPSSSRPVTLRLLSQASTPSPYAQGAVPNLTCGRTLSACTGCGPEVGYEFAEGDVFLRRGQVLAPHPQALRLLKEMAAAEASGYRVPTPSGNAPAAFSESARGISRRMLAGDKASWVSFRKCRDLNHTAHGSARGRVHGEGRGFLGLHPPSGSGPRWSYPLRNGVVRGHCLLGENGDHGTAAQPSRRQRDPTAELVEREGRGALGSSPQPLKAPAALLP